MDYRDRLIIKPGHKLRLKDIDPAFKGHYENHESALQELEHYRQKLGQMQALLYAEKKHAILIVLQALDAGGKDGTVNHVFAGFNPQGASVVGFKQPTALELKHDFLGEYIRTPRQRDGSQSLTARTTKMYWLPGSISWLTSPHGRRATVGSATSSRSSQRVEL